MRIFKIWLNISIAFVAQVFVQVFFDIHSNFKETSV